MKGSPERQLGPTYTSTSNQPLVAGSPPDWLTADVAQRPLKHGQKKSDKANQLQERKEGHEKAHWCPLPSSSLGPLSNCKLFVFL